MPFMNSIVHWSVFFGQRQNVEWGHFDVTLPGLAHTQCDRLVLVPKCRHSRSHGPCGNTAGSLFRACPDDCIINDPFINKAIADLSALCETAAKYMCLVGWREAASDVVCWEKQTLCYQCVHLKQQHLLISLWGCNCCSNCTNRC